MNYFHTLLSIQWVDVSERWLSVEEIAEHLGISKDTVYTWISKYQMPAHKVGRLWKFKAVEVDNWVLEGAAADKAGDQ